jgi:hypothetical protein
MLELWIFQSLQNSFPTFKRYKNIIFVRVHAYLESKVNLQLYKRAKFWELKISFPNTLIILFDWSHKRWKCLIE